MIVTPTRVADALFSTRGRRLVRRLGVATGQSRYPTPLGTFAVVEKQSNPWWYPPTSDWAKG